MTLEHYPGMTEKMLREIEAEANERWDLEASLSSTATDGLNRAIGLFWSRPRAPTAKRRSTPAPF